MLREPRGAQLGRGRKRLALAPRRAQRRGAQRAQPRERLEHDLRQWAAGEAIEIPIYDFATHARLAQTKRLPPGVQLIVEGLFTLYWPTINALYHRKIFIDAPAALCLTRRLARDTVERGRSPTSIRAQYRDQVRPSYERYIAPTAEYADVRLDGRDDPSVQVAAILARGA